MKHLYEWITMRQFKSENVLKQIELLPVFPRCAISIFLLASILQCIKKLLILLDVVPSNLFINCVHRHIIVRWQQKYNLLILLGNTILPFLQKYVGVITSEVHTFSAKQRQSVFFSLRGIRWTAATVALKSQRLQTWANNWAACLSSSALWKSDKWLKHIPLIRQITCHLNSLRFALSRSLFGG